MLKAARCAKISRNAHYIWLKEDPTYPQRFKEATEAASRTLEDEAVRRAHEGLRKAVRYKGKVVGYETEYSDSLLTELLRATNPQKFRPPQRIEHGGISDDSGVPVKIIVEYENVPAKAPRPASSTD